jgi:hypothetical protein
MLKALYDNGDKCMTIEEAQQYDQRPFRSMLIQRWAEFHPGRGFSITKRGKGALHEFLSTDIFRKDPTLALTSYFDPTAYRLRAPSKKGQVHVMPRRRTAA